MVTIAPTILDVARAVQSLEDTHLRSWLVSDGLDYDDARYRGGRDLGTATLDDAIAHVASNLAYVMSRAGYNTLGINTSDVRAAMAAHGASAVVLHQRARAVARRMRADFSHGDEGRARLGDQPGEVPTTAGGSRESASGATDSAAAS